MAIRTLGLPGLTLAARTEGEGTTTTIGMNSQDSVFHLRVQLNVTAVSGTSPKLIVLIEDTLDGGITWTTRAAMTVADGPGREVRDFEIKQAGEIRARWFVVGSDSSITFGLNPWAMTESYG